LIYTIHETFGLDYMWDCSMSAKPSQYKTGRKLAEVRNQAPDRIGSGHRPLTK